MVGFLFYILGFFLKHNAKAANWPDFGEPGTIWGVSRGENQMLHPDSPARCSIIKKYNLKEAEEKHLKLRSLLSHTHKRIVQIFTDQVANDTRICDFCHKGPNTSDTAPHML
jgi:hypothetical protein